MDRRTFLKSSAAVAIPAVLLRPHFDTTDLTLSVDEFADKYIQPAMEKMADTIHIPAPRGNTLVSAEYVSREALRMLKDNIALARHFGPLNYGH